MLILKRVSLKSLSPYSWWYAQPKVRQRDDFITKFIVVVPSFCYRFLSHTSTHLAFTIIIHIYYNYFIIIIQLTPFITFYSWVFSPNVYSIDTLCRYIVDQSIAIAFTSKEWIQSALSLTGKTGFLQFLDNQ